MFCSPDNSQFSVRETRLESDAIIAEVLDPCITVRPMDKPTMQSSTPGGSGAALCEVRQGLSRPVQEVLPLHQSHDPAQQQSSSSTQEMPLYQVSRRHNIPEDKRQISSTSPLFAADNNDPDQPRETNWYKIQASGNLNSYPSNTNLSFSPTTETQSKSRKIVSCPVCHMSMVSSLLSRHKIIAHGTATKLSKPRGRRSKKMSGARTCLPLAYTCKECPFVAKYKRVLYNHMRAHTNPLALLCEVCRRPFVAKSRLQAHMKEEHGSSAKPVKAPNNKHSSESEPVVHVGKGHTNKLRNTYGSCTSSSKKSQSNSLSRESEPVVNATECTHGLGDERSSCTLCPYTTYKRDQFESHRRPRRHKKNKASSSNNVPVHDKRNDERYFCEPCNFSTNQLRQYFLHLELGAHKRNEAKMKSQERHENCAQEESLVSSELSQSRIASPCPMSTIPNQNDQSMNLSQIAIDHPEDDEENTSLSISPRGYSDPNGSTELGKKGVKLVSDFMDFQQKPYACALCYYRTGKLNDLQMHIQNHLTGGTGGQNNEQNSNVQEIHDPEVGDSRPLRDTSNQTYPIGSQMSNVQQTYNIGPPDGSTSRDLGAAYPFNSFSSQGNRKASVPPCPIHQISGQAFSPPGPYYTPRPLGHQHDSSQLRSDSRMMTFGPCFQQTPYGQISAIQSGIHYTINRSNPNPYQCVYCGQTVWSFADMMSHFASCHFGIVESRSAQAAWAGQHTNHNNRIAEVIEID